MRLYSKRMFALSLFVLLIFFGCATTTTQAPKETAQKESPTYPPYFGPKKRLAVIKFENKVRNQWWDKSWEVGDGLSEMVTTELFKTNRFILIERAAFADVVKEQELGQTGLVQQATAAKTGQALGAQILILGAVTEFKYDAEGGGLGVNVSGINLGLSGKNAHVAIDLRMVDANTGQVLEAHRAVGKASSVGLALSTEVKGITFGGDTFKSTPLGKATRNAIWDAIYFIIKKTEPIPWSGAVVKVDGEKIFINAGTSCNIKSGDLMVVFSKGEALVDPTTGLTLGATLKRIGEIQVESVDDQFSCGQVVTGSGMRRGDVVKYK